MPTPTKRAPSRGQAPNSSASSSPALNAALVLAAVGYGTMLLVDRRELSWPPRELLSSLATLAGCLAMVGPLLLWRKGAGEGTVGELTWMVGGLILWAFDLSALAVGRTRGMDWAAPVAPELLGPVILAVMVGGWRTGRTAWSWTWTSVTGWLLGLIWVGMGALAMLPQRPSLAALS
ncbi:hypothetical protein [Tautonia sociabilis]|uniref:Uncharacterized protein n=1 Tax=Tautonia sociabilis TaxID=2080755 RepID=A0A432MNI0_9BACT|nr:hypothetical protein [Tautonia sociabilis]RUL89003.1 hypothetical protein TsocGM_03840 [Tautonia sociabilis]